MARPRIVSDLMSSDVRTLGRNDSLRLADDILRLERIRHLPVLDDDGVLVGILSQRDLFRGALARALGYGEHAQEAMLSHLRVKNVMTNDPTTVTPKTTLAKAARTMIDAGIGCLPVVADEKLAGILSESDFVRYFAADD